MMQAALRDISNTKDGEPSGPTGAANAHPLQPLRTDGQRRKRKENENNENSNPNIKNRKCRSIGEGLRDGVGEAATQGTAIRARLFDFRKQGSGQPDFDTVCPIVWKLKSYNYFTVNPRH